MLLEADLIAKRGALRWLAERYPHWTHQELATALALHAHSRARHTPPPAIASQPAVVQRILEIRIDPPEHLQRVPGPEAILYYLHRDPALQAAGVRLPRSQTPSLQDLASSRLYCHGSSPQAPALGIAPARGGGAV